MHRSIIMAEVGNNLTRYRHHSSTCTCSISTDSEVPVRENVEVPVSGTTSPRGTGEGTPRILAGEGGHRKQKSRPARDEPQPLKPRKRLNESQDDGDGMEVIPGPPKVPIHLRDGGRNSPRPKKKAPQVPASYYEAVS